MTFAFAVAMALAAYTMLSLGFVMQKKGIGWMGWKGKKEKAFYRNLTVWTAGFLIMNIYGVPSAIALKALPPHIVSAFAGWGIIMLVLFSYLMLKEKIYSSDYLFAVLIVAGIFLLGVFEQSANLSSSGLPFYTWGMVILCLLPLVIFVAGLLKTFSKKVKTACFASVSGISAGLMVVSLRLLVIRFDYKVFLYFSSLYLYLYIFFALLSFVALQLALKNGSMIAVGPVQYSTTIIYPLCATLVVFRQPIHPFQVLAVTLIVYSVVRILKKH
jgi:drug/metabolite transporter (DMT)-like permease